MACVSLVVHWASRIPKVLHKSLISTGMPRNPVPSAILAETSIKATTPRARLQEAATCNPMRRRTGP